MKYRLLDRDEIKKFGDIDRTEIVNQVYYHRNGELVLEDEFYDIGDWSPENKKERIEGLIELYDSGGVVFAAFRDDFLVGVSTLAAFHIGDDPQQLNLNGLWVSHDYRNKGVASTMVGMVEDLAKKRGATSLYVSATESKNTVEFYMKQGFVPVDEPDPVMYEKEPRDIHMVKHLR